MARRGRAAGAQGKRPQPHSARRRISENEGEIPEVYRDMLAEADARAARQEVSSDRPIKRRRVAEKPVILSEFKLEQSAEPSGRAASKSEEIITEQLQTTYDSVASDESDMEWEEVEIQQPHLESSHTIATETVGDLQITLDKAVDKPNKTVLARRRPVPAAEQKLRLHIHKVHLLCLLSHVQLRNLWCNNDDLQAFLKRMLSKQTVAFLNPKESMAQSTRSTTFIDGLKQASEGFSRRFRVTAPELRRPYWAEDLKSLQDRAEAILRDAEIFLSKEDFKKQAEALQGSRDFGAQLFCALLRSVGVEARLVCSLQPLTFSAAAKGVTPVRPESQYIVASSDDQDSSSDAKSLSEKHIGSSPQRIRRLGQPQFNQIQQRPAASFFSTNSLQRTHASSYPVFWVEAYNDAVQKWIPVDPLVTKTVAKPAKLEPPSSDLYNNMSYAIAFEEDASARDVTRRYVKAYNAKTRKTRIESTKDGENWWAKTMTYFEKPFLEDRDQIELSELTARSAAEPMPRNLQDFKDHPIYALERHLRRNQVIHPKRMIGQVSVGKSASRTESLEPVYRRADVHVARSADGWYRLGRDIKVGEQPLKHVATSRGISNEGVETPFYALFQTKLYEPPPIFKGRVPKNAYGNLDVYVPTMVPNGGFHLKHPEGGKAARILGIDYADAVTGFDFKGRQGTATFQGIVVADEYREALQEVLICLENERIQAELDRQTEEALRLWKHFLLRLRISERVKSYAIEGESAESQGHEYIDNESVAEGGGFIPDPDQEVAKPTPGMDSQINDSQMADCGSLQTESDRVLLSYSNMSVGNPIAGGVTLDSSIANTEGSILPNPAPARPGTSRTRKSDQRPLRYTLVVIPSERNDVTAPGVVPSTRSLFGSSPRPGSAGCAPPQVSARPERPSAAPIMGDLLSGERSPSPGVVSQLHSQSQSQSQVPSPGLTLEDSDSSLEQSSMLSHDPEDEDADPIWLMSD